MTTVAVEPADADARLDRWFRRHFPHVSHGRLERWLRTGQVRVDGRRVKAAHRVQPGEQVRVPPMGEGDLSAETPRYSAQLTAADVKAIHAAILHQDESLIVLNKPSGLAVQGGAGTKRHLDAMLDALAGGGERPRLVHRLDKDTSGVLVLARTVRAAAALAEVFRGRQAEKLYWAVVVGMPRPAAGEVRAALIKRGGAGGDRVVIDEVSGQRATTAYRTIESAGRLASWLELSPRTGRTHQLRVHCSHLGTPILADGKYGGTAAFLPGDGIDKRLHLHARGLVLPHPGGGTLTVTAPLPEHMANTFRFFGFTEAAAETAACG